MLNVSLKVGVLLNRFRLPGVSGDQPFTQTLLERVCALSPQAGLRAQQSARWVGKGGVGVTDFVRVPVY